MNQSMLKLTVTKDKKCIKWFIGKNHHLEHESIMEDQSHEMTISVEC